MGMNNILGISIHPHLFPFIQEALYTTPMTYTRLAVIPTLHQTQKGKTFRLFTSRVSGRGYKNGAVCVCVCQSVSTLTAELFDVRSPNLVQGLILITSRTSSMVKVKGQGHPVVFFELRPGFCEL